MNVAEFLTYCKDNGSEIGRSTLLRYEAAGLVTPDRTGSRGDRSYSEDHLAQVLAARAAVRDGMVEACREAQSELVAARTLNRQRAQKKAKAAITSDSKITTQRVAHILDEYPLAREDEFFFLTEFYRIFYSTTSFARLRALGAPVPSTLERRRREYLSKLAQKEA
jgi:DNA-binding transcriptional MerR regulator